MGVCEPTYYRCKQKYGGLGPSEVRRLRHLEEANTRLQELVAGPTLDKEMLSEVIRRMM